MARLPQTPVDSARRLDALAEPSSKSCGAWLEAVLDAERRGELLLAFDLAERGLAEHPGDLPLRHRAVLALARSGSTRQAARRYAEFGLDAIDDEDVAALGARIAKDEALSAAGPERRRRARHAAARYAQIHARTGGYYPAINAATLSMIAGGRQAARRLARTALKLAGAEESYYAAATRAEALLLLDDPDRAYGALEAAMELYGGDLAAVASTRRQLELVCATLSIDPSVLVPLRGPEIAHYCGHRIATPRFPAAAEQSVAARIAAAVDAHTPTYAYGSLASGADILWAEALLERGAELHVVLPFDRGEFVTASVAPSGPAWVERFERCHDAAAAVSYATEDAFLDDDVLYRYGAELAMGLALLRGRYLAADVRQLAVWDGAPAEGAAGTTIDVTTWRRGGRPTTIVPIHDTPRTEPNRGGAPPSASRASGRTVRAMLFGDIKGFSRLSDEQLPPFAAHVMGALGKVLRAHSDAVVYRNTWGDALYAVLTEAAEAAACALDLQKALAAIDHGPHGLPDTLALRLGAHLGPVIPLWDPVLDEPCFMGSHVSRTARIEPVTPPGEVYATEPFAAALELAGRDEYRCDYVGHMHAAKDYGRMRMYHLYATGLA